jgi:hypothetical protein
MAHRARARVGAGGVMHVVGAQMILTSVPNLFVI